MSVVSGSRVDMGPSDGVRLVRARPLMRDGVRLNAAVYTPRGAESRVPAVVELTPYTIDHVHRDGQQFARSGLAYVVADVRGRGDSEGVFETVVRDGADGHDLIEWIVSQPWSDGRVVLFGGSYTGWNQWLILGHGHPAIAAASPAAAFASGWDIPRGGIPNLYHAKWQGMVFGHANYATSGADGGLWAAEIRDAMRQGRTTRVCDDRSSPQTSARPGPTTNPAMKPCLPSTCRS
jgi:uncharacterized protein